MYEFVCMWVYHHVSVSVFVYVSMNLRECMCVNGCTGIYMHVRVCNYVCHFSEREYVGILCVGEYVYVCVCTNTCEIWCMFVTL